MSLGIRVQISSGREGRSAGPHKKPISHIPIRYIRKNVMYGIWTKRRKVSTSEHLYHTAREFRIADSGDGQCSTGK